VDRHQLDLVPDPPSTDLLEVIREDRLFSLVAHLKMSFSELKSLARCVSSR
jgi:hypothetical protein